MVDILEDVPPEAISIVPSNLDSAVVNQPMLDAILNTVDQTKSIIVYTLALSQCFFCPHPNNAIIDHLPSWP